MISNEQKKIIYINKSEIKKSTITKQTKTMRENINSQIRSLDHKFYDLKNIFVKMGIHRDVLYYVGKELVEAYKNSKNGIFLQAKNKRMKEALICWYCQHFYDEIMDKNSPVLLRLNQAQLQYNNQFNYNKLFRNNLCMKYKIDINGEKELPKNQKHAENNYNYNNSFFSNMKINNEIDDFAFSNINDEIKGFCNDISENIFSKI